MPRPIKGLSGSVATGDSTHYGTNDIDQLNNLLSGQDQSTGDATLAVDMNTLWKFRNQKLALRDPTNTYSSTVINPSVTANSNFQFNTAPSYYVFIDPDDSNKIKARNGRTGAIDYVDSSDASVVVNGAFTSLFSNATISSTAGANQYLWVGGAWGTIYLGPGTYVGNNSFVTQPNINLIGPGPWCTKLKLSAQHADNSNSNVIKSSQWDTLAFAHPTPQQAQQADTGNRLMGFSVDGNQINNATITTTPTTQVVSGTESVIQSWGAGIAYVGSGLYINDVWVNNCRGAGIILHLGAQNHGGTTGTSPTATQNTGETWLGRVENVNVSSNGQQGILVRGGLLWLNNFTTNNNGEQGLDIQNSAYWNGDGGFISHGISFLDGQNHANETASVYNEHASEWRITGSDWQIDDVRVEGPAGPGDTILMGIPSNPRDASGDTLQGLCSWNKLTDLYIDNAHYNALYLSKWAYRNRISAMIRPHVDVAFGSLYSQGVKCNGQFGNELDIFIRDLPSPADTTKTHSALIMGDTNNQAFENNIRLRTLACQYIIMWGNASNAKNNIDVSVVTDTDHASTVAFFEPSSLSVNYGTNNIRTLTTGSTANVATGSNGGVATTTGTTNPFLIPHGLYAQPNVFAASPNNPAAAGAGTYYVTADPTNVKINFTTTPASGYAFVWNARVNFQA